jgi:ectoine hydroxylase-related dioxygenase (phytanoyl-CoA dioxygenase family)
MAINKMLNTHSSSYFSKADMDIEAFDALCSQSTNLTDYPSATSVEQNILIYERKVFDQALDVPQQELALKDELCRALKDGPGVFIIKGAYTDLSVIDQTTEIFLGIVAEEKSDDAKGDHFGSNERIWNSIQKACVKNPDVFISYYSNPVLAIACEAWLGPYYRITAQMNNVKPGNKPQSVHRDYHLGFQSSETVARFPAHVQIMSQYLTLQGAIAHVDMPLEMGPTLLLPFSQQFLAGYLTYSHPEFVAYFDEHKAQLPFEKGDMVFFSPALFHGAGENITDKDRLGNLVQISSAFGHTMETLNNTTMIEAVYPALLQRIENDDITQREIDNTIAAVADGYSFPTNLDSDPPIGGNAPDTQQDIMHQAIAARWVLDQLQSALKEYATRRET